MAIPSAGYGHNPADKEGGWTTFTVTPSVDSGTMLFTITDAAGLLTTSKMIRSVIVDALDQWLVTNAAQLATNSVTIGNDTGDDFGGSNLNNPAGDGLRNMDFDFGSKTANTPSITTTSLTTAAITVSIPYGDVI